MRFSSSLKVGILTLVGLFILLSTILWIKGRSFSSGERIDIVFKDVNGMRPGSGVQMMGLRIGQVEEIIPIVKGDESYVKLKFVITEPDIKIPKASVFSIQQSGLIGEQFLEITPPKTRVTYVSVTNEENLLYKNDAVQIKLDKKFYDVGTVKSVQVLSTQLVPPILRSRISTKYAYKVSYTINLPGLILPNYMDGQIVNSNKTKKLRITMLDGTVLPYPYQTSLYTVVEPMRISDFLDLQYRAAASLTETTIKVNDLLSEDVIVDLKQSIENINTLTQKASSTMDKAEKLLESSRSDLERIMVMADSVTRDFNKVTVNVNNIIGDKEFKPKFISTADALEKLANNLNKIMDNTDSKQMAADLQSTMQNLNDITSYIDTMTKNDNLKKKMLATVDNINNAMSYVSNAMEIINKMTPEQKTQLQQTLDDAAVTTSNLKKFSEKLNKRFLLFRLMF